MTQTIFCNRNMEQYHAAIEICNSGLAIRIKIRNTSNALQTTMEQVSSEHLDTNLQLLHIIPYLSLHSPNPTREGHSILNLERNESPSEI